MSPRAGTAAFVTINPNTEGDDMADGEVNLGLAEAISMVRSELGRALVEGANSPIRFQAGPLEVEFSVEFTKEGGTDGGVRLAVVSFGAKGSLSKTDTHRVKFTFTPVGPDKKPLNFSDKR